MILASLGGFGNKKKKTQRDQPKLETKKIGRQSNCDTYLDTESKRIMLHVDYSVCSTAFRYLFADETRECTQSHG